MTEESLRFPCKLDAGSPQVLVFAEELISLTSGVCQCPEKVPRAGTKSKPTLYPLWTHFGTFSKTHF